MNIELHGFLPEHSESIAKTVWGRLVSALSEEGFQDGVVTVVGDRSYDHNYRSAPFFRVFSDKEEDFRSIVEHLKAIRMPVATMRTRVECILISKSFVGYSFNNKTEAGCNPLSGNFGP